MAAAAGGTLAAGAGLPGPPSGPEPGPERASIDSRQAGPETLFVGLPGASYDGGRFAADALAAGAWGAIVTPPNATAAGTVGRGHVIVVADPLRALQSLATAWRRELGAAGAQVIGVTGSTGKTSTKDLLLAVLSPHRRTSASRANYNTEIGLPLEILAAPAGTEVLVLEMAMRGRGQIAELTAIAEPDVGVIVSIGPVHLELLGTIENVAAAKAELIAGLAPGATAVLPAGERLLDPHRREDVRTITFGPGGDVDFVAQSEDAVTIVGAEGQIQLHVPFQQAHLRLDLLAAVAAAEAVGVTPAGSVALALSAGRGENLILAGGIKVIDGCYNANPMSMRAALADLADTAERDGAARRVAVLGDMLELGPEARAYHEQLGPLVERAGVDLLVTVGPLAAAIAERFAGQSQPVADAGEAAAIVPELLQSGDVVLVKGSLGVGLKQVCDALAAGAQA
ncbi:MAG TPA: UDP-N-acetylmuramoyl-tripeptide--D-alanyl-D-alanine ligase [Solirubrobacteraceae bacterium]